MACVMGWSWGFHGVFMGFSLTGSPRGGELGYIGHLIPRGPTDQCKIRVLTDSVAAVLGPEGTPKKPEEYGCHHLDGGSWGSAIILMAVLGVAPYTFRHYGCHIRLRHYGCHIRLRRYQRLLIKMMALPTFGHQDDGATNVWPQKTLELGSYHKRWGGKGGALACPSEARGNIMNESKNNKRFKKLLNSESAFKPSQSSGMAPRWT